MKDYHGALGILVAIIAYTVFQWESVTAGTLAECLRLVIETSADSCNVK